MGQNDTFIGVRRNILLSSPLPSIGKAYSLIIQDEKQRGIHATPAYPGDLASFNANNQGANFKRFKNNKGQKELHLPGFFSYFLEVKEENLHLT